MRKDKVIDLVRAYLPSPDKTNKYHPLVVEHTLSICYNEMLVKTYSKQYYDMDMFAKKFGDNGTPITVELNSNTGEYYSTLPSEIVVLPNINAGVKGILSLSSQDLVFAPMKGCDIKLIQGLECQQIDDVIGYTVYRDKVIYTGMTSSIASAGVVMDLIVPFHAYDDSDNVNFPKGQENTIISMALSMLGVIPPKDLVNNNSDTKTVKQ